MLLMLLPIVCVAIVGIAYVGVTTFQEVREAEAVGWPRAIALVSVIGVALEIPIPFVMALFFIDPYNPKIGWLAGLEVLLFVISLPCALKGKGLVRWWLALSSVLFLGISGSIYLVSEWQF